MQANKLILSLLTGASLLGAGSLFDPMDKLGLAYFTSMALMRGSVGGTTGKPSVHPLAAQSSMASAVSDAS